MCHAQTNVSHTFYSGTIVGHKDEGGSVTVEKLKTVMRWISALLVVSALTTVTNGYAADNSNCSQHLTGILKISLSGEGGTKAIPLSPTTISCIKGVTNEAEWLDIGNISKNGILLKFKPNDNANIRETIVKLAGLDSVLELAVTQLPSPYSDYSLD